MTDSLHVLVGLCRLLSNQVVIRNPTVLEELFGAIATLAQSDSNCSLLGTDDLYTGGSMPSYPMLPPLMMEYW